MASAASCRVSMNIERFFLSDERIYSPTSAHCIQDWVWYQFYTMMKGEMALLKKKLAEEERRKQMAEGKRQATPPTYDHYTTTPSHLNMSIIPPRQVSYIWPLYHHAKPPTYDH